MEDKLSGGGLNILWNLEKWKMSVFPYFTISVYFEKRDEMIL